MASGEPWLKETYRVNYQDGDKLGSSNDFQNSFHCTFVQPLPFLKKNSKSTVFLDPKISTKIFNLLPTIAEVKLPTPKNSVLIGQFSIPTQTFEFRFGIFIQTNLQFWGPKTYRYQLFVGQEVDPGQAGSLESRLELDQSHSVCLRLWFYPN